MLKPDLLKDLLHTPTLIQRDILLLLLASFDRPVTSTDLKEAGVTAGLRKARGWSVPSILRHSSELAISTPQGWELTRAGRVKVRLLLAQLGHAAEGELRSTEQGLGAAEPSSSPSTLLFVSHSATDKKLAQLLVNLLVASLTIPKSQIRCTSVPGCKLPAGSDAPRQLAAEISDATCFIGLLTENSIDSAFVLFELGARWGQGKNIVPLLGPDATYDIIPEPIRARHAVQTTRRTDVLQMLTELARECGRSLEAAESYEGEIVALLRHRGPVTKQARKGSSKARRR